ncbi:MAG: hypothetical protein DYH08_03980, partial [Actinobacteria bacterium ATB1]|nr:hypothetical protein [Actinobacteria bacterium ATB1]
MSSTPLGARPRYAPFSHQQPLQALRLPATSIDVCCCDGLTGLGDAIEAVWPLTVVQTCVVLLIRGAIRFCAWKDRKGVVKALKGIYQAETVDAA